MKARIRSIKPEVLDDEELWDLGVETGFPILQSFEGLWMYSDREGRFEWLPRTLKPKILPYWDGDFARVLDALASRRFVVRYEVDGRAYGVVRTFKKHQVINNREADSVLPVPPPEALAILSGSTRGDRDDARDEHASGTREGPALVDWEGKGRERKGAGGARAHEGDGDSAAEAERDPEFVAIRELQEIPELYPLSQHDVGSWRDDWAWIGKRPEAERQAAFATLSRSAWAQASWHTCTPRHIRKHWHSYVAGKEPGRASARGGAPRPASRVEDFVDSDSPFVEVP